MGSDKLSCWSPVMGGFKLNLGNLENLVCNGKQKAGGQNKSSALAKERTI